MTLTDMIIKANQNGYKGFMVPYIYEEIINYLDNSILINLDERVEIYKHTKEQIVYYGFKKDNRNLYWCNFTTLNISYVNDGEIIKNLR